MRPVIGLVLALAAAQAGQTGKIAGRVTGQPGGEPLGFVNVVVVGAGLGAATDEQGRYTILNVPAGFHPVEASMVGYRTVTVTEVRVEPDRTAWVDFRLEPSTIELSGVTVRAERPMVSREVVASRYAVRSEEIRYRPGDRLVDVVMMQAPSVARTESTMHVRGGRAAEVDYLIDGVSVVDPLDGELGIELSRGVADEVVFLPGGFSAEYGRAMSGVLNLITIDPGPRISASYRLKSEKPMPFYYDFGYTDQGVQLHLPVLPNLRFVANAGATTIEDWDPRLFKLPHKGRADYSVYGKGYYDWTGKLRLALSAASYRTQYDRYKSEWQLRLDQYRSDLRRGDMVTGRLTWMPGPTSFYGLTVSQLSMVRRSGSRTPGPINVFSDFRFLDTSEYVVPAKDVNNPWGCPFEDYWFFYTRGNYEETRVNRNKTLAGRLTANAQVSANHQLVGGITTDLYDLQTDWTRWPDWHPVRDTYHYRPTMVGAYFQDKIEYEDLYADAGLRFDHFRPNATYKLDPNDRRPDAPRQAASVKSQVSPRLGISFRITDWLFARANYGYYFQVPLFSQLYDNTLNPVTYRTAYGDDPLVVGNPDLKPERTQSYEVGFQGEVVRDLLLTTNLWRKDVYDLIGTREVPALPQRYVSYFNVDFAKLTGADFIVELRKSWAAVKLSYTLSYARGTSSYANQAYYEFIRQGDTVPMVEYTLDFDQRNRFFLQFDGFVPQGLTHWRPLDLLLDSIGVHVLGYLGNGFPYTPPGGKGDPQTWNTMLKPWRSSVDAALSKQLRLGPLRLGLVVEVLNALDIRDVMNVYPGTGLPNDDGELVDYIDFYRPAALAMRFGDPDYDPRRDYDHDGFINQYEDYRSTYLYHRATVDWVNNYGPPRRARLGVELAW